MLAYYNNLSEAEKKRYEISVALILQLFSK